MILLKIKGRSQSFSFWIYFFQIWDTALILTLWSFIVTFDIVTNKDFEIFTLSEMTEHGIFTIVS